ncbi:MAG: FHA domain-containing protein [Ignavibacteriaceae bacterium]|nr:FHA domain-containing protein [Ignavibacteriaceae bacterium]
MAKKDNDETEFWESFDESADSFNSKNDDETIDETDYRDSSGSSDYEDESDRTVSLKKKKPEILGFLVVKKGKRKNDKFDLTKEDIIIGKNPRCCDIPIDDDDISRIHCRIRKEPDKNEFHFYDCGSTNGSFVNDEEVHHVILKSHDKIVLGENVELIFVQV